MFWPQDISGSCAEECPGRRWAGAPLAGQTRGGGGVSEAAKLIGNAVRLPRRMFRHWPLDAVADFGRRLEEPVSVQEVAGTSALEFGKLAKALKKKCDAGASWGEGRDRGFGEYGDLSDESAQPC